MRSRSLLRTPSQSICVFCACRLSGISTPALSSRQASSRGLKTSSRSSQDPGTATASNDHAPRHVYDQPVQAAWGGADTTAEDRARSELLARQQAQRAQELRAQEEQKLYRERLAKAADEFESSKMFGSKLRSNPPVGKQTGEIEGVTGYSFSARNFGQSRQKAATGLKITTTSSRSPLPTQSIPRTLPSLTRDQAESKTLFGGPRSPPSKTTVDSRNSQSERVTQEIRTEKGSRGRNKGGGGQRRVFGQTQATSGVKVGPMLNEQPRKDPPVVALPSWMKPATKSPTAPTVLSPWTSDTSADVPETVDAGMQPSAEASIPDAVDDSADAAVRLARSALGGLDPPRTPLEQINRENDESHFVRSVTATSASNSASTHFSKPAEPPRADPSEEKQDTSQALFASREESAIPSAELKEREALARRAREMQADEQRHEAGQWEQGSDRSTYKIRITNNRPGYNPTPIKPYDPDLTSNWSIFKRQPSAEEDRLPTPSRSGLRTPEDVDAKFEQYRQQRVSAKPFDMGTVPYGPPEVRKRQDKKNLTCARCGELGHFARECPNPPQRGRSGRQSNDRTTRSSFSQTQGFETSRSVFAPGKDDGVSQDDRNNPFDSAASHRQKFQPKSADIEEDSADSRDKFTRPRKFGEDSAPARDRARDTRRGRSDRDDEASERPKRGRRDLFAHDEDVEEDEGRSRRGRNSRNDEEDDGEDDFQGLREARAERKRARQARHQKAAKEADKVAARKERKAEGMAVVHLPEFVSVSRLAQTLGVKYEAFVNKMERLGFTNTSHDHVLSAENASLIAMEFNFDASFGDSQQAEENERDLKARPESEDKDFLPTRPPVVAIMGHVDHGKTTILDYLRNSSVAATEHGGITQHIGAFSVGMSSGKTITFLDTPGHAAFLAMRQRGATVTDIVILVVAADDSVKPQTLEALKHAQDAKVPIIVAINKIDKEEANIERVKQDLARHGVEIEDFGGDTQVIGVSGKTGEGMEELEEAAVTLSEILDHRAETDGPVEGWVIEATTKRAGRVATVLVKRGTLKQGDVVVAGKTWARVRSLHNEAGQVIVSAGPGTPVEVDGWRDQPAAGDEVLQAPNEQKATDVVDYRLEILERTKMAEDMEAINELRRLETEKRELEKAAAEAAAKAAARNEGEELSDKKSSKQVDPNAAPSHQTVPFIVKADVSGSVEAVTAYLLQMSNPLCSPTLLRSGVGPVSEFDIEHAAVAEGHIIAFNLPSDPQSKGQADKRGVKVLDQNIIYRIVDDVKAVLEEKLPPTITQRVTGEAEVAMAFEIGIGGRRKIRIAGCKIRNGVIGRGSKIRVTRGGQKVYEGTVSSLKNVKKDVQEMRKGTECGVGFDGWEAFEAGDQVQTYDEKEEKRTLPI